MSDYLLRRANGTVEGPYRVDELRHLAAAKRVGPEDQISRVGQERWVPLSMVSGLRGFVGAGRDAAAPSPRTEPQTEPRTSASVHSGEDFTYTTPAWATPVNQPVPAAPTSEPARDSHAAVVERAAVPVPTAAPQARAAVEPPQSRHSRIRFAAGSIVRVGWVLIGLALAWAVIESLNSAVVLCWEVTEDPTSAILRGNEPFLRDLKRAGVPSAALELPPAVSRAASTLGKHVMRVVVVAMILGFLALGYWLARRMRLAASGGRSEAWWYWGLPAVPLVIATIAFVLGVDLLRLEWLFVSGIFAAMLGYSLMFAGIALVAWGESMLARLEATQRASL